MPMRRRALLRLGGLGSGIGLIATAAWSAGKWLGAKGGTPPLPALDIDCASPYPEAAAGAGYPAQFSPAAYFAGDRNQLPIPPARNPPSADRREFHLSVSQTKTRSAGGPSGKTS